MMPKLCRALFVSVVSIGVLGAPALAQDEGDPAGPVAQCVRQINEVRAQTVQTLNQGARRAVAGLAALDENGAGEDELTSAATEAAEAIKQTGAAGVGAIHRIAAACLGVLASNDAPPAAARAVLSARDRAIGAIHSQTRESVGQVRRALRRALAPEPDGGPERLGESSSINAG